ncbi:MAG TPA: ATP-dependent DNA ligase [Candidatus Limnocylindrales bacterium]|nr:ATP-dependent DNA ligase [Candidatus Limnocylindrales bacterium]
MSASFESLSELLEKVEATKKRLEIIDLTANYLRTLNPEEIEAAVNMMVGRAFPNYSQRSLDVSWSTLTQVLERISKFDWSLFRQAMASTGDIGSATKAVLEQAKTKKQTQLTQKSLTIAEVRKALEAIAQTSGTGSRTKKERLITALLSQATPVEAKYLVKIFTGEMRTGLQEGLMEQAVAKAFQVPVPQVQHASMVLGDIGEVAAKLKTEGAEGLENAGFNVFRPVKLMLAQTAQTVNEALTEQAGKTAFEYKYDGARVQIHKQNSTVQVFSRRLTNVTESLPEIVETVKSNIKARSAIVEGEVVALDSAGYPIAFQHLMRRFKRVRDISGMAQRIPLTLYLFDVLYVNGDSLITLPYTERRQILAQNAGGIPLSQQLVTEKVAEAEGFLKEAIAAGHEGLMAKKLDSRYTPGRRGKKWLKIKTTLEPLDLVITAAEYGYGRRKGWLSDYYLAARDPETGGFLDLGKTFKGLTDDEIIEMTKQLKESIIAEEGHRVIVVPKIVVEVAYNEIQRSPKYRSRMALRFARITRIRDDKTPEEADAIGKVRKIYEKQLESKGRYL